MNTSKHVDVKNDYNQVKNKAAETAESLKNKAAEATDSVTDTAREKGDQIERKIKSSIDEVRSTMSDLPEKLANYVEENPLKSIGISALVGVAIAGLLHK